MRRILSRLRGAGSLRTRLVLSAAVFVLVAIVVTGLVIGQVLERFVRGEVAGRLDLQIAAIESVLAAPPPPPAARPFETGRRGPPRGEHPPIPETRWEDLRAIDGPPFERPRSGWYWQVETGGEILAASRSLETGRIIAEDEGDRGPPHRLTPANGPGGQALVTRSARIQLRGREVTILASAPFAAIAAPLRDATLTMALTLALLGAALVAAILVQVRFGLAPLERLRAALVDVRSGKAERIEGEQPLELQALAQELNALIAQDAANLRQARLHVANLAHGLKTPLATLSAAAERLPDEASRAGWLGLVGLMDRRIRHHLRRARTAALGGPVRQRTSVRRHGEDLASMLVKFHAGNGIAIETDLPPDLFVAVDAEDLDEMLGNLMDNACRHAGSRVVLGARREGRFALLRIADDGPGLSPRERDAVLKPGRRLDETAPGHGFGLPITAEIAELYAGALSLAKAPEGGLEVLLRLPTPHDGDEGPGAEVTTTASPDPASA